MEDENHISYHEYKRRLKKITEEIKKEKKKTCNKIKKSENLLKLEEELNKLNSLYNDHNNEGKNNNINENKNECENINNLVTDNLYLYNEISKKALKNRKKAKQKELEEIRNEKLKNKCGEKEYEELLENLKKLNKTIFPIPPDGNCLYESILHQLRERNKNYKYTLTDFLNIINKENFSLNNVDLNDYRNKNNFDFSIFPNINPYDLSSDILRFLTSIYLLQNKSLFINFIYVNQNNMNSDSDDDPFFNYCKEIINGIYGSEIEIKALSNILQKKITVYDVNMNVSYEENYDKELHICFHHKLYALGKHYNSVIDLET
ncbi:conserved Plasmodium protein, unknown function [Plasmodium gallinaceum]|uniref:OTU domain-containing protein n=1 Tax=Plasmodium gallinaceum TaxID=5849 RepID=A0A1J1GZL7_PLAGA|nr:conserved Plasmodium protein, unknown function [Plasmodium gallinaceum]CRG96467.1 conserved Plasmodium protein, unknown function [Plasmodium gallinaceum]